jgi:hypothetical protein
MDARGVIEKFFFYENHMIHISGDVHGAPTISSTISPTGNGTAADVLCPGPISTAVYVSSSDDVL